MRRRILKVTALIAAMLTIFLCTLLTNSHKNIGNILNCSTSDEILSIGVVRLTSTSSSPETYYTAQKTNILDFFESIKDLDITFCEYTTVIHTAEGESEYHVTIEFSNKRLNMVFTSSGLLYYENNKYLVGSPQIDSIFSKICDW